MPDYTPIRYGMQIRLRHCSTGSLLKSSNRSYCHPGGSGQQIVNASALKDNSTVWIVKGAHELGGSYPTGEEVKQEDVIRLEHVATHKNLHSHNDHPSPLTRQQEVTAYGADGIGDDNDNWVVKLSGSRLWTFGIQVRLVHKNTSMALHSHSGYAHPLFTAGDQEVTAFDSSDSNDFWQCNPEDQLPLETRFKLPLLPKLNWMNTLSVAGSIASITGWTILTLKESLRNQVFVNSLAFLFSTLLILGILLLLTSWLISRYMRFTFNPQPKLKVAGFWLLTGPIYLLLLLVAWRICSLIALAVLSPLLKWIFGI
ncbi:MAG: hypothetical protein PHV34_22270 [Verrucomicrobiae bacterium]|nr:hypothetical protein [Verrucomicrobiae bacterium]